MPLPLHLLVVDDSPQDFLLAERTLRTQGLDVVCERVDSREKLDTALAGREWDGLLLDILLPGMDALDILGHLHTVHPDLPVIVLSGSAGEERISSFMEQGAWDLVCKERLFRLGPSVRRCLRESMERRQLRAHETMLRAFLDGSPYMMGMVELQGDELISLHVNAQVAQFMGRELAPFEPRKVREQGHPPEIVNYWTEKFRQCLTGGMSLRFEYDHPMDGAMHNLSVVITPIGTGPEGRPRFSFVAEDVTELRRAERTARELAERLRHLFENMLDGYARCRLIRQPGQPDDIEYLEVNPGFERMTGMTNPAGRRMSEVMPRLRLDNPEIIETYARVVSTGQSEHFESYIVPLDLWLAVSAYRVANDEFVALFNNVSERKRLEEQTRQRRHDLELLQQKQVATHTAAAIAHELNQPLNAVANYAEAALSMLKNGIRNPEKLTHALEGCASQSVRAGRTLHELLAFLRSGKSPTAPLDVNEVVREAIAVAQADGLTHFRPVLRLQEELPLAQANRAQVLKVLLNLLRNAAEAVARTASVSRGITITVATDANTSMVRVTVRDRGEGIAPHIAAQLFEPFFSTKPDGMGLGLAISRALIKAQGGQLWVEPTTGPGATFHFTLPQA